MKKILFVMAMLGVFAQSTAQAAVVSSPKKRLDVSVSNGLTLSFDDAIGTAFVAEPAIASYQVVNNDKILVFGKYPGKTSLFVMDTNGETIYSASVYVAYDTAAMKEALRSDFPSLNLKLTPVADAIAVSGTVPTAAIAAEVIALLDGFVTIGSVEIASQTTSAEETDDSASSGTSGAGLGKGTMAARNGKIINRLTIDMPTQVTVRVRIAEVTKSLSEKLGIQWGAAFSDTKLNNGLTNTMIGLASSPIMGLPNGSLLEFAPEDFVPNVTAMIDALATEQLVSVLAEPNLSCVTGETAAFTVGGLVPYVTGYDDEGRPQTEEQEYGIYLEITPTVLSDNKISLRIRPEVSELDYQPNGLPGLITRKAETTVELASGQSFALGGLMSSRLQDDISKLPGIGDLPLVGSLARSNTSSTEEKELVIIATAYLSTPNGAEVRIPNAQIYSTNVIESFLTTSKTKVKAGNIKPVDFMLN